MLKIIMIKESAVAFRIYNWDRKQIIQANKLKQFQNKYTMKKMIILEVVIGRFNLFFP